MLSTYKAESRVLVTEVELTLQMQSSLDCALIFQPDLDVVFVSVKGDPVRLW